MNNGSANHVEVSELLPWYVNGTLEQQQAAMVHHHLGACATCREDYDFLRKVDGAVNKASPAPIVPQPPVGDFLASLDTARESVRRSKNFRQWGIAASIVAAVVIGTVVVGDRFGPTQYDTVTNPSESKASMDYVLQIEFQSGTSASERAAIFNSLNGRDIVAGEESNAYRLVVPVQMASRQDLEQFTAGVEEQSGVVSVEVLALQLPVRKEE